MLVRRKSACKTSAGSSKMVRWLTPLLGPNLDPKTGPKQRPKRRNENVIQFWTPFWGPYFLTNARAHQKSDCWDLLACRAGGSNAGTTKNGVSHRRISLLPAHVVQADLRLCSLNMNVNSHLFLFVRPKSGCYCTRNKVGRRERKACINTHAHASASQICLQNLCGQQQNGPMADPTFGSKSGSQNGAQAKT